jgi:hypothetical protein
MNASVYLWEKQWLQAITLNEDRCFMRRKPMKSNSSEFCLTCGLCCNGVLHAYTAIHPNEVDLARSLRLTVLPRKGALGFKQPCRLYKNQRCSKYLCRPSSCKDYQCALLRKYLAGELKAAAAEQVIQQSKKLFAALLEQLPPGCSFDQLRTALDHEGDSALGILGSDELRQANAPLILELSKLMRYLQRHFGKPKQRKAGRAKSVSKHDLL